MRHYRQENNESVAREINLLSGDAVAFQCDVRDETSVKAMVGRVHAEFGAIDILINNAGVVNCRPIDALDGASIARTFEVNVYAHFWTIRAALPIFKVVLRLECIT